MGGAAQKQIRVCYRERMSAERSALLDCVWPTRSEIIVPVFDRAGKDVVETIDVESEEPHAFSKDIQDLLQACSDVIRPLWELCASQTPIRFKMQERRLL